MTDLYLDNQEKKNTHKYWFIHQFLPHPTQNKRSKFISHKALAIYSFIFIALLGIFTLLPKVAPGILGYASNIYVKDLLSDTNLEREKYGLSDLKLNSTLSKAAEDKAKHMFQNGYWAHVAPDGTQPWDFIISEGYDYSYAGENLAKNFNSSDEVVKAWMNSPSHKENILNEHYDEIGFAVVNGELDGYETTLVVQMFGKKRLGPQLATTSDSSAASTVKAPTVQKEEIPVEVEVPEVKQFVPSTSELVTVPAQESKPVLDIPLVTKTVSFAVGGFVTTLLGLDVWYSKRKAIPKFTGYTLAHLALLIVVILGVIIAIAPGKVL